MHYREIELQLALLEKTTSLLKRRQMIQELEHKQGYTISYVNPKKTRATPDQDHTSSFHPFFMRNPRPP